MIEPCIKITVISQKKAHICLPTKVRFLNDVCLRQMMLASPMMTATPNDAWLRHILGQTSHHCDQREQHHICEANASYRRKAMHHLTSERIGVIMYTKKTFVEQYPVKLARIEFIYDNVVYAIYPKNRSIGYEKKRI